MRRIMGLPRPGPDFKIRRRRFKQWRWHPLTLKSELRDTDVGHTLYRSWRTDWASLCSTELVRPGVLLEGIVQAGRGRTAYDAADDPRRSPRCGRRHFWPPTRRAQRRVQDAIGDITRHQSRQHARCGVGVVGVSKGSQCS